MKRRGVFGVLKMTPFLRGFRILRVCSICSGLFGDFRCFLPQFGTRLGGFPIHSSKPLSYIHILQGKSRSKGGWTTTMPVIETRHVFYSWGIPAFFLEPGFLLVHVNKDLFRVRGLFHRFLWWRSHKIPLVGIGGVEICANFGWQLQGFLNQIPSLKLT